MDGVAVVGMSCRYADARNPRELWQTVLARRRAFRRIPDKRLRLDDYGSLNRSLVDRTYVTEAAVITNFELDRSRYRVSAQNYRSADPAHWLALDCAAAALEDAGCPEGRSIDPARVGVLVGNTLTGDYSRAASMRLRWPYVRRVLRAALEEQGLPIAATRAVLERAAERYRAPFPEIDGETLAGWLSNTIAGRVCNHFGFQGGGFVVDGACASSLLAVSTACSAVTARDLDVALAGGVDVSLDPFELVGFARAGALASDEMRVYDRRSAGFWPGEGCGFVVLMRHADAQRSGRRIYAVIRGWGVSSDGQGGLTRPEAGGQTLALERAYARAGYGIDSVAYFEGHGTGTSVGDDVELAVLSRARAAAGARQPAGLGSVKANIGHTKAAAGVAGLIKAVMAVHRQVLPPMTGCDQPREEFGGAGHQFAARQQAARWPADAPLRASVSAMGFGGINAHVTLENDAPRRFHLEPDERACLRSDQDAELISVSADSWPALLTALDELRARALSLSRAELSDLAIMLQRDADHGAHRVALVAHDPAELRVLLERAAAAARQEQPLFDPTGDVFVGHCVSAPVIGFLFPGQGSPQQADGGRWASRFARVAGLYRRYSTNFPDSDTRAVQPAIVRAALAALRVLRRFGVEAQVVAGHSLGELVALYWGGALSERSLMRLVELRAEAVAMLAGTGSMASLAASGERVRALIAQSHASIAAYNAPQQTVIAGSTDDIRRLLIEARRIGIDGDVLRVTHPFHSALIEPAARHFRRAIAGHSFAPLGPGVYSMVTAAPLPSDVALADHLERHLLEPVQFVGTAAQIARHTDFVIEVGPGSVLARLMRACGHDTVLSLDAGGPSLRGLMRVIGAAFVRGTPVRLSALANGRFSRPFQIQTPFFLPNPCEQGEAADDSGDRLTDVGESIAQPVESTPRGEVPPADPVAVALNVVAQRAELPVAAIRPDHRLLADLHFNSISVAQIVLEIAAQLNVPPPMSPTEFAAASIEDIVEALTVPAGTRSALSDHRIAGVESWVRRFRPAWLPTPLPLPVAGHAAGAWHLYTDQQHPLRPGLEREAAGRAGDGTIVCLGTVPEGDDWRRLLTAARATISSSRSSAFVIVHDGGLGSGFGASLAQEAPGLTVVSLQVPFDSPDASRWILDEALAARRPTCARITSDGTRYAACVERCPPDASPFKVGADDVFVVTGGAKGVTAECVLALAASTGAALGLIGRADAAADQEVQTTLGRMNRANLRVRYEKADVADRDALAAAVRRIEQNLGPVTGVIHGAAVNRPTLIEDMDDELLQEALAPKITGAENLATAVDMSRVRLFAAFGSIIARTGMRGEAHYALANEALAGWVQRLGAAHRACRCLTIEWSVWEGTGMGARLGRLTALEREGIVPLTIDEGVHAFVDVVCASNTTGAVLISGRFGGALTLAGPALPLARFTEQPRIFYPGLELVSDSAVSTDVDRYLPDHTIEGNHVLPGVMGLEAMVQAAAALTGAQAGQPVRLYGVRFDEAIVVPPAGNRQTRVAACVREDEDVEVALRCDATGFGVNHFAVRCRFDHTQSDRKPPKPSDSANWADASELYDELFFQRGRFQRVSHYEELHASRCVARILPALGHGYFAGYHAASLWLGDPGSRDAAVHAIQACVPMRRLVPTHVDQLAVAGDISLGCRAEAVERWEDGADYVYDLNLWDDAGQLIERWDGLHLRDIGPVTFAHGLPDVLLQPWLTREWRRAGGDGSPPQLARMTVDAPGTGLLALQALNGAIERRPDGRPVCSVPGVWASAAHDLGTTVAVVTDTAVGCDLQEVVLRTMREWDRLLGAPDAAVATHVSRTSHEPLEHSATRLWAAREAARKCGLRPDSPLVVTACDPPVVRFRSGVHQFSTVRLRAGGLQAIFAFAMGPRTGRS